MAEKSIIVKEVLEHSGIYGFSEVYEYLYLWFKEESYGVVEEKYNEKVSGTTRDIAVEWKCSKSLSDYFKIDISVRIDAGGISDVEVEIDGKKKKMNKGRLRIEFKGTLIRDPDSKWDASPLYRFLRDAYNKYIIPARVETQEDKVKKDISDVKEELKKFLDLQGRK
jgi:hypothetical protein